MAGHGYTASRELGPRITIDIDKGWVPTYQTLEDRKDVLTALKKQAAKADAVYLAPDPDREGEAIAWHLKEALGLDEKRIRQVSTASAGLAEGTAKYAG